MNDWTVTPSKSLRGRIRVPGDKSISHRALLFGALASGTSQIWGFLPGGDCLATQAILGALGVQVDVHDATTLTVYGNGLRGLKVPAAPLNCVRSGTTIRLLAGIMAGQSFDSILTGEEQLLRRPMARVAEPLRDMGASIETTDGRAPLTIQGRPLHGYTHKLKVASAQIKSALLLAGLYGDSSTSVWQPGPARDHTERLLSAMGVRVETQESQVTIYPPQSLAPFNLIVPGDVSSAAFPLVAALLVPDSQLVIEGVGVNPTRTGLLDVLWAMGANIELENDRLENGEPVADLLVRTSELSGTTIQGDLVVRMIDEFPILAVAATQARGVTTLHDAAELRVKETDRIATVVSELTALGAKIEALPDGFVVEGPTPLRASPVTSHGDHRLAMSLTVAGLITDQPLTVQDAACASDSFPGFLQVVHQAGADVA
jgi:3-phosphoshikimate 1-carboxyvinyltransferase